LKESAFQHGRPLDFMSTAARPKQRRAKRTVEEGDLERRRGLGQFFTPPDVAAFMWEMVQILRGHPWHADETVIDPACGDGAFLRVAIEHGQKPSSCYGLDIDPLLVPQWRKDRRLRGARLFHENGLINDAATGVVPGAFDLAIGNPPFAGTGLKDLLHLLPRSSKSAKQARSLFDDELLESAVPEAVESAALISLIEREKLDRLARQMARYNCWRFCEEIDEAEDEAQAAGEMGGGLFSDLKSASKRSTKGSDYEQMAKAIAGTPADRLLNPTRPEVRDAIRRMAGTAVEVFFVERFVELVRPGGMVAVIVPDSILASDQLGPLRRWFLQHVLLLAVVSLPHKVFTGVGANARTGIIFARRYTPAEERANAKAKAIASGLRLASDSLKKKVFMVSPKAAATEQARVDYLNEVLSSVESKRRDGTLKGG
jgi:N-6 DNA methylase